MSALTEKLKKARELRVEAGAHVFLVRRPTDLEMGRIARAGDWGSFIPQVFGWEQVSENDIIPGSNTDPLSFDADVCRDWLSDRVDLMSTIVDRINDAYLEHKRQVEAIGKN